jgi:hypothetical protein
MSFEAIYIEPEHRKAETEQVVGVFIPGIDANIRNTGNRIQEMANQTGIPFLMTDVLPQGKGTIEEMGGMTVRDANQPSGDVYRDVSRSRLDFVRTQLEAEAGEHESVLLMGDSLGVPVAQGMQLHAEEDERFDALLLRDGWNLGTSDNLTRGYLRYGLYQARNIAHDLAKKVHGNGLQMPDHGFETHEDWQRDYGIVGMVKDVGDLMRSFETRNNTLQLARVAGETGSFVLKVVMLGDGLSGNTAQSVRFREGVYDAYFEGAQNSDQAWTNDRYPYFVEAGIDPGWHSDLLDPIRGAEDVADTLKMLYPRV